MVGLGIPHASGSFGHIGDHLHPGIETLLPYDHHDPLAFQATPGDYVFKTPNLQGISSATTLVPRDMQAARGSHVSCPTLDLSLSSDPQVLDVLCNPFFSTSPPNLLTPDYPEGIPKSHLPETFSDACDAFPFGGWPPGSTLGFHLPTASSSGFDPSFEKFSSLCNTSPPESSPSYLPPINTSFLRSTPGSHLQPTLALDDTNPFLLGSSPNYTPEPCMLTTTSPSADHLSHFASKSLPLFDASSPDDLESCTPATSSPGTDTLIYTQSTGNISLGNLLTDDAPELCLSQTLSPEDSTWVSSNTQSHDASSRLNDASATMCAMGSPASTASNELSSQEVWGDVDVTNLGDPTNADAFVERKVARKYRCTRSRGGDRVCGYVAQNIQVKRHIGRVYLEPKCVPTSPPSPLRTLTAPQEQ